MALKMPTSSNGEISPARRLWRSSIASRVSSDMGGKSGSCKVDASRVRFRECRIYMRLAAGFRRRHHYLPGSDVGYTRGTSNENRFDCYTLLRVRQNAGVLA